MQRPRRGDRELPAEAAPGGTLAPGFVFVVVVPAAVETGIENLARKPVLPPRDCLGIGEVEKAPVPVPELLDDGRAVLRGKEPAFGREPRIGRMVVDQHGLQIGDGFESGRTQLREQGGRIRELVAIPGEDVAALAAAGIAGAEMDGADRNALGPAALGKGADLGLRTRIVGMVHRGECEPVGPAGC